MRIGIDARYLDRRFPGIGIYCRDIISSLLGSGPELRVHLFVNTPILEQGALDNFHQHEEPFITVTKQPQSVSSLLLDKRELRRFTEGRKLDVLHIPHWYPNCGVPCKLVSTIHDVNPMECPQLRSGIKRWFFEASIRKVCRKSNGIIFISNAAKAAVSKYFDFDDSRTAVIPNMIADSAPRDTGATEPMKKYVLHVCGAGKFNKNTAAVIKAFKLLKKEPVFSDLHLYIIGRLSPEAEKAFSEQISGSVAIWNYVPRERLNALYRGARCLLFPSFCEGFGLPIVEAMASFCPVVTSNLSATAEIGRNGAAYLVDPHKPADIAAGLATVLLDDRLRQGLVERGLARIREYSPNTVGPKLVDFYETVLSSR